MMAHFERMTKLLAFEPGDTAYYILGLIVEMVEQRPLAAVFRNRFFTPTQMQRSALDDEADLVAGRVAG